MNNKCIIAGILSGVIFTVIAFSAAAQTEQIIQFDLQPGDRFEFRGKHSSGRSSTWVHTYQGKDTAGNLQFTVEMGGIALFTPFMSLISDPDWAVSPHSTSTIPNMLVGSKWSGKYSVRKFDGSVSFRRKKSCETRKREQVTVKAGKFEVLKVECWSKRSDRRLGKNITTWYDMQTGRAVKRSEWWSGSNSGTYNVELVSISLATRE